MAFSTRYRRNPEFLIHYMLQVGLLGALAALTAWLWPDAMFVTPLALISFGDWLWAFAAALLAGLTSLVAYCVILEMAEMLLNISPDRGSLSKASNPAAPPLMPTTDCEQHTQK